MAHNLEPNMDCLFCVQALNQNDEGESAEIEMNTSRAAKVAATPGAVVGGVLAGPMSGASTAAVDTWNKPQPGNPLTKVVTGGLSLGAGILGGAAGVAASPGGGCCCCTGTA